jgi:hypothetical protein
MMKSQKILKLKERPHIISQTDVVYKDPKTDRAINDLLLKQLQHQLSMNNHIPVINHQQSRVSSKRNSIRQIDENELKVTLKTSRSKDNISVVSSGSRFQSKQTMLKSASTNKMQMQQTTPMTKLVQNKNESKPAKKAKGNHSRNISNTSQSLQNLNSNHQMDPFFQPGQPSKTVTKIGVDKQNTIKGPLIWG